MRVKKNKDDIGHNNSTSLENEIPGMTQGLAPVSNIM